LRQKKTSLFLRSRSNFVYFLNIYEFARRSRRLKALPRPVSIVFSYCPHSP
jgi:hypothetical protein